MHITDLEYIRKEGASESKPSIHSLTWEPKNHTSPLGGPETLPWDLIYYRNLFLSLILWRPKLLVLFLILIRFHLQVHR